MFALLIFAILSLSACSVHLGYRQVVMNDGFYINIKAESSEARNRILFNDEETALVSMPSQSALEISDSSLGIDRSLVISRDEGEITYTYSLNDRQAPFDEDARQWFASQVPQILRQTGLNARERSQRIYAQSGVNGLLAETEQIDSDSVKAEYLELALTTTLRSEEEKAVFLNESTLVSSDYERRKLLTEVIHHNASPAITAAALKAAAEISSDYELSELLIDVPANTLCSPDVQSEFFIASQSVESDYELSQVFIKRGSTIKLHPGNEALFLRSLESIDSDYEMKQALIALLDMPGSSKQLPALIAVAAKHIDSDYELATMLLAVLDQQALSKTTLDAVRRAATTLDSDHEKGRVLIRLNDVLLNR
ncbi:hypothetical protein [Alteromonas lipolytica]|uniref:hypothetical protein n=1 Tax=Alteromonas lipolytica TaxID=1856405 RepID=UPI0011130998|nr:hypothetical protein [Alteromonas lipolytica]